jgi:anti-anti-sigma factor
LSSSERLPLGTIPIRGIQLRDLVTGESSAFTVDCEVRGDRAQVILTGELDAHTDHDVHAALDLLARQGIRHFRIDMSALTYVGSSGINILTTLLDAHPLSVVTVVGTSELFRRLLRVTGMETHLALVS